MARARGFFALGRNAVSTPRIAAIVPALDAAASIGEVVSGLRARAPWRSGDPILVVDDGSNDSTSELAARAGAEVVRHSRNRGKGAALRTGLGRARELGAVAAVTVDADAQHLPEEAERLAAHPAPATALVLGIRDLVRDGAPRANRFSNGISNYFLSRFARRELHDTQCGLRRYPVSETLELGARDDGYAYEAECVLRAARAGWQIVEVPVRVHYPPEDQRVTHFHVVKDPARIVFRVLATLAVTSARRARP
jgi:glycosyltransferase involved in cell wall biosynthesis